MIEDDAAISSIAGANTALQRDNDGCLFNDCDVRMLCTMRH